MIAHETHEPAATSQPTSVEEIRAELYRLLDDLATSRAESTPAVRARFTDLWNQIGRGAEETLH